MVSNDMPEFEPKSSISSLIRIFIFQIFYDFETEGYRATCKAQVATDHLASFFVK
jgi:hypothetical protein